MSRELDLPEVAAAPERPKPAVEPTREGRSGMSLAEERLRSGEVRTGRDQIRQGTLGARLERDPATGGARVAHVYEHDPNFPGEASPLARPEVDVVAGDVITQVNGVDVASVPHVGCSCATRRAGRRACASSGVTRPATSS